MQFRIICCRFTFGMLFSSRPCISEENFEDFTKWSQSGDFTIILIHYQLTRYKHVTTFSDTFLCTQKSWAEGSTTQSLGGGCRWLHVASDRLGTLPLRSGKAKCHRRWGRNKNCDGNSCGNNCGVLWLYLGKTNWKQLWQWLWPHFAAILLHLHRGVILNCLASAQAVGSGLRWLSLSCPAWDLGWETSVNI